MEQKCQPQKRKVHLIPVQPRLYSSLELSNIQFTQDEFIESLVARRSLQPKQSENESNEFYGNNDNHEASISS